MKQVYQCEWCDQQGTAEEISEHEKTCIYNKTLRSCFTCASRKGLGLTQIECQIGENIPKGKYIEHCQKWQEGEKKKIKTPKSIFSPFF